MTDGPEKITIPSRHPLPSPAQLRAARALLNWSMCDLACTAKVSLSTVRRMEGGKTKVKINFIQLSVWKALEQAGIRTASDPVLGQGVWLASSCMSDDEG